MGRLASVCLVVTLASLGLWACTEYVAGQLEYAPELGPPLAILGGVRLYAPWGWIQWIDEWSSMPPPPARPGGPAEAVPTAAPAEGWGDFFASPMSTHGEAAEGEVPTTPEDLPL